MSLTLRAESGEAIVFGKQVSELQSDVAVSANNVVSGTLNYVTDYTEFSSDPELQQGNYVVFHWSDPQEGVTSLKVGIKDGTPMVECIDDPDRNGVFRILSPDNVFVVEQSDGTHTRIDEYPLSDVTLAPEEQGEG